MEKDISKLIIGEDTYNFRDNSIPEWARESSKPSYSASDVGALPIDTNIPVIQYIANESSMPETPTEGVLYLIGEEEPTLISFNINTNSYQAVEGMTCGEWVESEYNTSGLKIIDDYIWTESGSNTIVKEADDYSSKVTANEMIESNFTYYQFASGGSSD